ncbi:putative ubiquitin-conjugating enzyme E2 38 [Ziziphus jujuba]|uniref:Ubiquitin-conjugating enzyme E2 38 n=1 Tax=Ziziphus jujuba TaxID=326968 RepID=A0A6P3ZTZ8_ZIZJJ|nr:putative ubiquitin-conjugating enzyme E2 38 [Ziziphus jujuba]
MALALSKTTTTTTMTKSQNGVVGGIEEPYAFERFHVVSDESDHHYVSTNKPKKDGGADCFTNGGSRVYKKIMQEWKMLDKHLPDSIYVRVYEKRIDLLRAVIVGAAGTPYHDGLFFFDLAFPPDYPNRPPMVNYRSFGLRLNPNLYANGRVCLSLLNTWAGRKTEKWNPSESTVLQVLLSIQALVLNEKPYFNEPGHGMLGRAIWEKKSQAYNEDVFFLSCKTMLFLLRRPSKNFEDFTAEYFRNRANEILTACRAYASGHVRVGYYRNDGSSSSSMSTSDVSEKFKGLMKQLYPELVAAFRRTGASLGTAVEHLEVEKNTTPFRLVKERETKGGNDIAKKVIGKIKMVLGLKKNNKNKVGKSHPQGQLNSTE